MALKPSVLKDRAVNELPNGVLISWATPATNCPSEAIFSERINWFCALANCSVRSFTFSSRWSLAWINASDFCSISWVISLNERAKVRNSLWLSSSTLCCQLPFCISFTPRINLPRGLLKMRLININKTKPVLTEVIRVIRLKRQMSFCTRVFKPSIEVRAMTWKLVLPSLGSSIDTSEKIKGRSPTSTLMPSLRVWSSVMLATHTCSSSTMASSVPPATTLATSEAIEFTMAGSIP